VGTQKRFYDDEDGDEKVQNFPEDDPEFASLLSLVKTHLGTLCVVFSARSTPFISLCANFSCISDTCINALDPVLDQLRPIAATTNIDVDAELAKAKTYATSDYLIEISHYRSSIVHVTREYIVLSSRFVS